MKKNIHLILILALTITLFSGIYNTIFAVTAYPYPIEYTQTDGNKITILLKGDEKVKWAETTDGYSILHNREGSYEYAILDEENNMIPSGIMVKNVAQRSAEDYTFLISIQKKLHFSVTQIQQMKSLWKSDNTIQKAFPSTGNRKLLVILANFSNTSTTYPQSNFDNYMNQSNYNGSGSFKDYYIEASYGQLIIVTTVSAWVTLPNTHDYYGPEAKWGQFALDAITAANNQTSLNYSQFDNDADGIVDGVAIFHQGQGQEETGSTLDIWSHSWDLSSAGYSAAQRTFDGVLVDSYTTMPERNSTGMGTIGVMCHEFGHNLGAPDFYDIDYSTNGQYDGTGNWDLMASGSWNGTSGNKPAHPNAYIKTMIYNWATPTLLTSGTIITLNNAEQNTNSFYRYNTTTANEYYLIENRQQQLFDTYIPGHGMIIYHVDDNYISTVNGINAGSHQGMYPVCANATGNPTTTYGTINSTGCPFPGTGLKTSFTDATTPWSKSWAGANTNKPITSISENITNKTVTFTFMGGSSCTAPAIQATNFSVTNLTSTSMTLNWVRGNGNNVIVIAKANSSVDTDPVSGTNYASNSSFGAGTQLGTGNYVVYNGSGTFVTITGLTTSISYYFAIYEYATTGSCYLFPSLTGSATTPCGTINSFPYNENFNTTTIPSCYTQQNIGTGLTNMWTISTTASAGGTVNELRAMFQNIPSGTSRLILTPINTINKTRLDLSFKHFYDDYGVGLNYKIQTSNDLVNWTDVGWTYASGLGNSGPVTVTVPITQNLNNSTTYIAFVLDGNLYYFDYWYIDDINITALQAATATLNVSATSLPSFGNVNQNYSSSKQYFGVSGSGLSGNITITAPSGFSVSSNCNSAFSSSLSLTPTSGNIAYTRIWVKYNPTILGASNGNITVSTAGTTDKTVAVIGTCITSAIPSNYYSTSTGSGATLKSQLHNIIKGHIKRSYTNLWTDFQTTDKKYNGKVWDMYSDKPCDSTYEFTYITNQCGSYSAEGGCYNREHSLPNSWWGGTTDTMYSDLNTLVPTDGYVNNMRSNYTFGTVTVPNWTSSNGSKRGPCSYPGYTGTQANVFEPINEYKGDFARIYLYMATRYESKVASWISDANANDCFNGTTFPAFETWQINLLMDWHNNDPVSQKEINRNNAVYSLQGNRNPFIDHPEYVALIWQSTPIINTLPSNNLTSTSADCSGTIISSGSTVITESGIIYSLTPNPVIGGVGVTKVNTSPLVISGNFTLNIGGLIPMQTYYIRAFAKNSFGTSYGNDIMFTTDAYIPVISTDSVKDITANTARIYCSVVSNLYSPMQFSGIVYSTNPNPFSGDLGVITASTNPLDTTGTFILNIINLLPATTYYVKAYASNTMGVSYGSEISFTTSSCLIQSVPYIQSFETTFPPSGWLVNNPDAGKTWQNKLVAGKSTGTDSAAYINFYSYITSGQTDDLISPAFDLNGATNPKLSFKVAYRYYSATSLDTLRIFYSTDCGLTYNTTPIYNKGGAELSTGGFSTSQFTPALSADWREEVINLSSLIGNTVRFKFQAVNDYGNNLYIDDIQINPNGQLAPTTYTYNATVLNADTVILYGRVNPNSLSTSVQFDYGNTISYSNSITALPSNISGDTNVIVYQYLVGLPLNSTYHYRVNATNSLGTSYGNDVIFKTPCSSFNIPFTENFDNSTLPNCWTTQNTTGLTDKWTVSATANAGGTAYEMKSTYQLLNGTTKLVTPPLNTLGKANIKLSFKHFYDDFSTGATIKIQSSTDAINWIDENFMINSGNGNVGPANVIVNISNNTNSATTYLAFVITDSLGKYDYWYIDNVVVEEGLPSANFTANKIYSCLNDSVTFTNTSTGSGITSYLWNFGNSAIPQTANGSGPYNVKYTNAGLKTISLTINGQYTTTKTNFINIQANPNGGNIYGSGNICLGSSTGSMVLVNYNGNILKWQKRYNSGSWIDISTNSSSYSETPATAGNWEYRAVVSYTGCNSAFSDSYTIIVYQTPVAGTASSIPSSICINNTSTINLDSYVGNIQWQQSLNGTNGWINVVGGNGANNQIYNTPTLNTNTYYKALVSNGVCQTISSTVTSVTILPSPNSGTASCNNSSICEGNTTSLVLSGFTGDIQWEQSNDSIIWNNVSGGTGPTNSTFTTPGLYQSVYYRAKLTTGNCNDYSNIIKISVLPIAQGGNITINASPICGGSNATLTLNNSVGSIQWIQSPNGAGNWTDVITGSGFNSDVFTTAPLQTTTYYRAKLTNGNCPVVYSPISNIVVYPQVTGGIASANTNVCTGNTTTISLTGSYGSIIWQETTDTLASWINATGGTGATTTIFTTPALITPRFYRAKLSGSFCPDAYSNIIAIQINNPSVGGEVIAIQPTICEGNTASVSVSGYNGSIQWQQSMNGIDNWNDIINGTGYNSPTYTSIALSSTVYYRTKVTNGGCTSEFSSATPVTVDLMPVSGSITPINQSICTENNAMVSVVNSFGNIQWMQSNNGTNGWTAVSSGSGYNTAIYTSSNLLSTIYYRTEVTNGVCPVVNSSTATVIVSPLPLGGNAVLGSNNFCNTGSSSVTLSGYTGNIQWQQSSDSLTWINVVGGNGSTNSNYTTPSLSQSTFYRAKLTLGSCNEYSNVVRVVIYPTAIGGSINVSGSPMCAGNTANLTLNNSVGSIQWIQSATGSGNWTNVTTGNGYTSKIFTTEAITATTYYRAKLTSGNCPIVYSPISNIVVYAQTAGGTATAASSDICTGSNTSVSLSAYSGSSIAWEQSTDSTIWTVTSGGSGANTATYITPSLTSDRYYRAKLSNGNCPVSYSDVAAIKISTISIGGSASLVNDSLCEGFAAQLNLNNYNGSIQWQQSADGSTNWTDINTGNGFITDNFTTSAMLSSLYYRAKVSNGSCSSVYSEIKYVNVDAAPVAGQISTAEDSICNTSLALLTLQNFNGSHIQWQTSTNFTNNWTDIVNANSVSYSHSLMESAYFRVKVNNGVCNEVYTNIDSVYLRIQGTAGEVLGSKTICKGTSTGMLTLSNWAGDISKWQKSYNNGIWIDITNTDTIFTENPDSVGNWMYRAVIENYPCTPVYAEAAVINVVEIPSAGMVEGSKNICTGISTDTLTAVNFTANISKWQKRFNEGNWTDIVNTSDKFTEIPSEAGKWEYRIALSNGVCDTVFSAIAVINVYSLPVINAGQDITICKGENATLMAQGGNVYQWNNNVMQGIAFIPDTSAIYSVTGTDSNNCSNSDDVLITVKSKAMHLKLFLEGLYAGNALMNSAMNDTAAEWGSIYADMISIELRDTTLPYSLVDTFNLLLPKDGEIYREIPCGNNTDYYIVIRNRNHIETWSSSPVSFASDTIDFDFTTAAAKAYGNNQKFLETDVFGIYAGDVNQDGLVDGSDISTTEMDNNNFVGGYKVTDVNGDGLVDGTDMSLVETNNNNFVGAATP